MGALFRKYAQSFMRSHDELLKLGVHFVGKWLPVHAEDAYVIGLNTLIAGLEQTKGLAVHNFSERMYDMEMKEFMAVIILN